MLAGQGVEDLQGLKETLNATFDALQRLFRVSHHHVTIKRASENVKVREAKGVSQQCLSWQQ
jgi:hypothetical protein